MSDPGDLAAFWAAAWGHLRAGVADRHAPARLVSFATVSPEGLPEVRTVALRHADEAAGVVEVHTDIVTPKVRALQASPRAEIMAWLPEPEMQIRLAVTVEIRTGDAVEAAWAQVPPVARVSYGTVPEPGLPIADAYAYEKPPVRERFAVLRCAVERMDLVELGARHRRAGFAREDGWRGCWLAP